MWFKASNLIVFVEDPKKTTTRHSVTMCWFFLYFLDKKCTTAFFLSAAVENQVRPDELPENQVRPEVPMHLGSKKKRRGNPQVRSPAGCFKVRSWLKMTTG